MILKNKRVKISLLLITLSVTGYLVSCNSGENTTKKAESALDAGREFVRASLDGKYNTAAYFLLKDSVNLHLLGRWEENYKESSRTEREQFKKARILINSVESVNDSTTILNFSNSFKKQPQTLKVVKQEGEWVVDFKYTFSGDF